MRYISALKSIFHLKLRIKNNKTIYFSAMIIAQNLMPWISYLLRTQNILAIPLHVFSVSTTPKLHVSTHKECRYIAKATFCFFHSIFQWIHLIYKIKSFKIPELIQTLHLTVCISLHFAAIKGHFRNRHEIANLFNELVAFERRHRGKN